MKRTPALALILLLSACGGGSASPAGPLGTFQSSALVLGQPSPDVKMTFPASQSSLGNAGAAGVDGTYAIFADVFRHRLLGYLGAPQSVNQPADFVIGQQDFMSSSSGVSATQFDAPRSASLYQGRLLVADEKNSRVLLWNTVPTNHEPADVVLGQPTFTSKAPMLGSAGMAFPSDAVAAGGRLFVADYGNNRVLIWNALPTVNGTPADVVLGQPNFSQNAPALGAQAMNGPAALWSDGTRLLVADRASNRVLVWLSIPTMNGQPADLVLGQPDFVTDTAGTGPATFWGPSGLAFDGARLFVADGGNSRVLVFDGMPAASGAAADHVLGQSDFLHGQYNDDDQDGVDDGHPSARTMHAPSRIAVYGDRLYVPEFHNARVSIFTK